MNKTILISHHPPFLPIIKAMAAEGYGFICLNPEFAKSLVDLDLPARALGEFSGPVHEQAFKEAVKVIAAAAQPVVTNGMSPGPASFIHSGLAAYLYPRMADLCLIILTLDLVKIDAIMLHNDVEPMTRAVALWAKQRGVPCVHVPHAIYQDVNRGGPGTDVHDLITASHIASAGPFQSEWYKLRVNGKPPGIVETGLPQYDSWANVQVDRAKARRLIRPGYFTKPVVTYASTWPQGTNALGVNDSWAYTYMAFLQGVKPLTEAGKVQVIVKLHPRGGEQNHQWHAQEAARIGVECAVTAIPQHNPFIMQATDILITYGGSNLLLEAAHIPGIKLLTTHGFTDDPEIGRVEETKEGMGEAIEAALDSPPPDTRRLLRKYLGRCDGNNWLRVKEMVTGLC